VLKSLDNNGKDIFRANEDIKRSIRFLFYFVQSEYLRKVKTR
jgi:hypothetical protein